ncbi:Zinc finger, RING-type [Corchorus olitorius]|uniref:Zinc finger, RING-type n=1 Tax=Corchorus olitorius TaxID=93759 RepID=A0A1R3FXX1_9ROSI|nr:Zinc finger, RING-type [Corchorus olitorius]
MENEDAKQSSKRVPFTQLDQVHSDFAMAMAMQEQERAFSWLETIESDSEEEEEYDSEASYESNNNDYEYFEGLEARGDLGFLEGQDSNDDEDMEDEDEIDPDDLSYEELIALGEIIGVEERGLSQNEISSCLVPCKFQSIECKNGIDRCVICQVEYEEEEALVALPNCEHPYHSECISKWLQIKKICPICNTEISLSMNSSNV